MSAAENSAESDSSSKLESVIQVRLAGPAPAHLIISLNDAGVGQIIIWGVHALVSVWEQFCVSIAQQSWSCACRSTVGFVALFRHIIVITLFLSCVGIFCVYSLIS